VIKTNLYYDARSKKHQIQFLYSIKDFVLEGYFLSNRNKNMDLGFVSFGIFAIPRPLFGPEVSPGMKTNKSRILCPEMKFLYRFIQKGR
jgi:hypothetical protein